MAKSERQLDELRQRLNGLLAEWGTEISAVMGALEEQESLDATQNEKVLALENQVNELAKLRQRIRERDLALDHLTKTSKEREAKFAELEKEHKTARARIEELEKQLAAQDKPAQQQKSVPQDEVEAMRAELAARKLLVKSMRADAERGKTLEKELSENRDVIAKLKESVARHARTVAELRRGSDGWEQKYRQLAETASKQLSRESDSVPRAGDRPVRDKRIEPTMSEPAEVDGSRTVVIDMTEPLRKARDERRRKNDKR